MNRMVLAGLALLALASAANAQGGVLFVGDVAANQIVRFDDTTAAPLDPSPYISIFFPEGIGGTNTRLAVASGGGFINIYDTSTGVAQNPPLLGQITGFTAYRLAFSPDGQSLYAAGSNEVRQYSLATGTLLNVVRSPDSLPVWGVAINPLNNQIYFTSAWSVAGGRGGIFQANPDLSGVTTVVPNGANGATSLAGITFRSDGSFYVVNGAVGDTNNPLVLHYAADGSFLRPVDMTGMPAGALISAFDAEIGPNGNLFVTSQNGACVVEFNTANDTFSRIFIPPHEGGIVSAKTLHFSINNVQVPADIPEPGALALLSTALLPLAGVVRRRRA